MGNGRIVFINPEILCPEILLAGFKNAKGEPALAKSTPEDLHVHLTVVPFLADDNRSPWPWDYFQNQSAWIYEVAPVPGKNEGEAPPDWSAEPNGEHNLWVPVPLAPDTEITATLSSSAGEKTVNRTVGDMAFSPDPGQWAKFWIDNNLRLVKPFRFSSETDGIGPWTWDSEPAKRVYTRLQLLELLHWARALLRLHLDKGFPDGVEGNLLTALRYVCETLDIRNSAGLDDKWNFDDVGDIDGTGDMDDAGNVLSIARWLINEKHSISIPKWPVDGQEMERLLPERVEYGSKEMTGHARELFDENKDKPYARVMWEGLAAQLGRIPKPTEDSHAKELLKTDSRILGLRNLFFFGERLLWPVKDGTSLYDDGKILRIPEAHSGEKGDDAQWVPAVSLLGLTLGWRGSDLKNILDGDNLSLKISINTKQIILSRETHPKENDWLCRSLKTYWEACEKYLQYSPESKKRFQVETKLESEAEGAGPVCYQPKLAYAQPYGDAPEKPEGSDNKAFQVPESILDALEEDGRLESPLWRMGKFTPAHLDTREGHPVLGVPTPQRQSLRRSELLPGTWGKGDFKNMVRLGLKVEVTIIHQAVAPPERGKRTGEGEAPAPTPEPFLNNGQTGFFLRLVTDGQDAVEAKRMARYFEDFLKAETRTQAFDKAFLWMAEPPKPAQGTAEPAPKPEKKVTEVNMLSLGKAKLTAMGEGRGLLHGDKQESSSLQAVSNWLSSLQSTTPATGEGGDGTGGGEIGAAAALRRAGLPAGALAFLVLKPKVQDGADMDFNLILAQSGEKDEPAAVIALKKAMILDFFRSTEHLSDTISLTFDRSSSDPDVSILWTDFINFNKAWLWMHKETEEQASWYRLTQKGHLLANTCESADTSTIRFRYDFTHEFGLESSASREDQRQELVKNEKWRYAVHRRASTPWYFSLFLDHQTGVRMLVRGFDHHKLPFYNPVPHPAAAHGNPLPPETSGETPEVGKRFTMAIFSLKAAGDGQEELCLHFQKEYFELCLKAVEQGRAKDTAADQEDTAGVTRLREAYETLMAMFPEGANSALELVLEEWNFDNTLNKVDAQSWSSDENPSLLGSLRLSKRRYKTMDGRVDLAALAGLLEPAPEGTQSGYEGFIGKLKDATANSHWDEKFHFKFTLNTENWSTETENSLGKVPIGPGEIGKTANIVRVGLFIARSSEVTGARTVAVGDLFPAVVDKNSSLVTLPGGLDQADWTAPLLGEDNQVRKIAHAEAKAFLDKGSFCKGFTWFEKKPEPGKAEEQNPEKDPERFSKLLGPHAPFCWKPAGHMGMASEENRSTLLFTVPLAFRPLALGQGKLRKALSDDRTVYDFACFCLKVLEALCRGGMPPGMEITGRDKAPGSECGLSALDAVQWQEKARTLRREVAQRLAYYFLAMVEDDEENVGELRKDRFRERLAQRIRNKRLDDDYPMRLNTARHLRFRALGGQGDPGPARQAVAAILAKDITWFSRAKGFALHLFHGEDLVGDGYLKPSYSSRLYSLQIGKLVEDVARKRAKDEAGMHALESGRKDEASQPKVDMDRFTFTSFLGESKQRFLIDILDDETYDNEFQIMPQTVLGRSGEDILEQANFYPAWDEKAARLIPSAEAEERDMRVKILHHNPEWVIKDPTTNTREEFYLLPSRLPPSAPVHVNLVAQSTPSQSVERPDNTNVELFPADYHSLKGWTEDSRHDDVTEYFKNHIDDIIKRSMEGGDSGLPPRLEGVSRVLRKSDVTVPTALIGSDSMAFLAEASIKRHAYMGHCHFLVEPDEEAAAGGGLESFVNDRFIIEVEEHPRDGWIGEKNTGGKAPAPGPGDGKDEPWKDLVSAFQYWRQTQVDTQDQAGEKPEVKLEDLEKGLRSACAELFPATKGGGQKLAADGREPRKIRQIYTLIKGVDGYKGDLVLDTREAPNNYFGSVIGASFMEAKPEAPAASGTGFGKKPLFVLRLTFLLDAAFNYRVRLRTLRNYRDIDHDGDSDINPCFLMESAYSAWAEFKNVKVTHTAASMPEGLKRLPHAPMINGEVSCSLTQWAAAGPEDLTARDLGDRLGKAFSMPFMQPPGEPDKGVHLWSPLLQGQRGIESEKTIRVNIVYSRLDRDTHPIAMGTESGQARPDVTRDQYMSRALGTNRSVPANESHKLFQGVIKAHIPTTSVAVTIRWEAPPLARDEGEKAEASGDVIMEVKNWELDWNQD
ncbi:MAG: hypothetical protein HZB23_15475 [Deltaproteobacteria bacterium]|nr:hypothetical protein [Deltaproteobacteria bacterium]